MTCCHAAHQRDGMQCAAALDRTAHWTSSQVVGRRGPLMRAHDWAATPLGPPDDWPSALKLLVGVMLGSNQPMFIPVGALKASYVAAIEVPSLKARGEWAPDP